MMLRVLRFVAIVAALALYVVTFWGGFSRRAWPGFICDYAGCATRATWRWCHSHLNIGWDPAVLHSLTWLVVSIFLGGLVPLLVMLLVGRTPEDVGLGLPNRWGRRVILAGLAIVLPMSFVFAGERLRMSEKARATGQGSTMRPIELPVALGVSVPEHLLLTGVVVALLLPGLRLSQTREHRKVKTPKEQSTRVMDGGQEKAAAGLLRMRAGVLAWLELGGAAQPGDPSWRRALTWWGLDSEAFWAILGGGFLFGLVHMGAGPVEFVTSFPGGVLLCYVTWRSGSIWPGWCVHVAQMALVGGMMLITMAVRG